MGEYTAQIVLFLFGLFVELAIPLFDIQKQKRTVAFIGLLLILSAVFWAGIKTGESERSQREEVTPDATMQATSSATSSQVGNTVVSQDNSIVQNDKQLVSASATIEILQELVDTLRHYGDTYARQSALSKFEQYLTGAKARIADSIDNDSYTVRHANFLYLWTQQDREEVRAALTTSALDRIEDIEARLNSEEENVFWFPEDSLNLYESSLSDDIELWQRKLEALQR